MGNLREFMLKKGNTKRSSPPAGAKGNCHVIGHELIMNYFCLFPQYLLQRAHHLA